MRSKALMRMMFTVLLLRRRSIRRRKDQEHRHLRMITIKVTNIMAPVIHIMTWITLPVSIDSLTPAHGDHITILISTTDIMAMGTDMAIMDSH